MSFNRILLNLKTSKLYSGFVFFLVGMVLTCALFELGLISSKKIVAAEILYNGQIISQSGSEFLNGADIIIPSGATVQIDGVHNFNSLTVESGGSLTTSDYNRYGKYKEEATTTDYKNAGSLFDLSNQQYSFMVRGVINTGTVHNKQYGPASAKKGVGGEPDSLTPDDVASITFFQPTDTPDYVESNYLSSAEIGSAFAYLGGPGRTLFTDTVSSDSNRYIPFEYMFFNRSGNSGFGFSYCNTSVDCTVRLNNAFVSIIGIDSLFDETSAVPQIKTFESYQTKNDLTGKPWPTDYSSMKITFANFFSDINTEKYFYKEKNYDFANDKKIILKNNLDFMSNPTIISDSNVLQYEYYLTAGPIVRNTFNFYPTTRYNSPLGLYIENCSSDEINGYPTLSKSLFQSLPTKINTEIIVNTLIIENGEIGRASCRARV